MENPDCSIAGNAIVYASKPTLAADILCPVGQVMMYKLTTKRGYTMTGAGLLSFKTRRGHVSMASLIPGEDNIRMSIVDPDAGWGPKTARTYDEGYLIGRLAAYGQFRGFYPTPTIMIHRHESDKDNKIVKITKAANFLVQNNKTHNQRLIPKPTLLSYAGGAYGIECSILDQYADPYMLPITREPLLQIETTPKVFQQGFLQGVMEVFGGLSGHGYNINWNPSEWLEIVQRMLWSFGVGCSHRIDGSRHFLRIIGTNLSALVSHVGTPHDAIIRQEVQTTQPRKEYFQDDVASVVEVGMKEGFKPSSMTHLYANGFVTTII